MSCSMIGVPVAAEIEAMLSDNSSGKTSNGENIVRLSIDAAIKNMDGDTVARMVQEGFSEIAVTTGGKVYEY